MLSLPNAVVDVVRRLLDGADVDVAVVVGVGVGVDGVVELRGGDGGGASAAGEAPAVRDTALDKKERLDVI